MKLLPLLLSGIILLSLICGIWFVHHDSGKRYEIELSKILYDRTKQPIAVSPNSRGHYVYPLPHLPQHFAELLVEKEDRYFYYHPGINPLSILRTFTERFRFGTQSGGSTISQQLAKNLLHTETSRNLTNKAYESLYALALEITYSKEELLLRYANTVYLGNQIQGFETAAQAYFAKPLSETNESEQISLLATLSHPSSRHPWHEDHSSHAAGLFQKLRPGTVYEPARATNSFKTSSPSAFELQTIRHVCVDSCQSTIDSALTETLRTILASAVAKERDRGVRNGALVVINPKTSELLAIVGSTDPTSTQDGSQINTAITPRPIGSTIKPFIYLEGFKQGLRPYSVVEDREYQYPIATGFSLYPKNYDGHYRGEVTLHEALSNSLNVPTVKVLEYVGLDSFYSFLSEVLAFSPIQPYESYQYGIALGGLEMDLLTLSHYFSTFPRGGTLAPLKVIDGQTSQQWPPQSNITETVTVASSEYIELVQQIISDRLSGVNQFGLKSNLNLPINNYAVKTGTSRDFHDSWVVGYTPDLVVGVWLGNVENEPLDQVTGQSGAGAVWQAAMEYLITTAYYTDTPLDDSHVVSIPIDNSLEWGLPRDEVSLHRGLLQNDQLIVNPHNSDTFVLTNDTSIPLQASRLVRWSSNGTFLDEAAKTVFTPTKPGTYEIMAETEEGREIVTILITQPQ